MILALTLAFKPIRQTLQIFLVFPVFQILLIPTRRVGMQALAALRSNAPQRGAPVFAHGTQEPTQVLMLLD